MVSRILKRLDRFPFGVQNECKVITHMDGKHIVKAHQVILHSLWKTKQKQVERPIGLAPWLPACRKDGIGAQLIKVGTLCSTAFSLGALEQLLAWRRVLEPSLMVLEPLVLPACVKKVIGAQSGGVGASGVPSSRKEGTGAQPGSFAASGVPSWRKDGILAQSAGLGVSGVSVNEEGN